MFAKAIEFYLIHNVAVNYVGKRTIPASYTQKKGKNYIFVAFSKKRSKEQVLRGLKNVYKCCSLESKLKTIKRYLQSCLSYKLKIKWTT